MRDAEWAFFEPFARASTGRPSDYRRVLDGIFWVTRTGAPWRDLPEELGKWNSVYQQFRRWSLSGLWDVLLDALSGSGAAPKAVQMIDSTVIRPPSGSWRKRGLMVKVLVVRAAACLKWDHAFKGLRPAEAGQNQRTKKQSEQK